MADRQGIWRSVNGGRPGRPATATALAVAVLWWLVVIIVVLLALLAIARLGALVFGWVPDAVREVWYGLFGEPPVDCGYGRHLPAGSRPEECLWGDS